MEVRDITLPEIRKYRTFVNRCLRALLNESRLLEKMKDVRNELTRHFEHPETELLELRDWTKRRPVHCIEMLYRYIRFYTNAPPLESHRNWEDLRRLNVKHH